MWRETTRHERNMAIWREELDGFVPPRVLDFHVHLYDAACIDPAHVPSAGGHPCPEYSREMLLGDLAEFYPGRETAAVCFGSPHPEHDQAANDRYVADSCDGRRMFALRLIDPDNDPDDVRADVAGGRFVGFKPYLTYVRKADPNTVEVREMLPDPIMRIADEFGLIVMLHIPRKARLADPLNHRQVRERCERYPRAKIVLAHIGRAYYLKNVVGHIERFADLPNCYVDLAMLNHAGVLEYAFSHFPAARILYGTDLPIAAAPGKSVEINNQYTYVTPVPWELSICDGGGRIRFTSFLYEELRAIRDAVGRLGLGRGFVEDLFYNNGMRLLGGVPAVGDREGRP
ncbi:MAG: hypothetical protein BIFFINMI_04338 [Phycisphaerae bacterium]|nr:hypothetical protein [Phycisphaerae bacterium]